MGKFHSTFNEIGSNSDFSPAAWEKYFFQPDDSCWQHDLGGAVQFLKADGTKYSLILGYQQPGQLSISYDRYNGASAQGNFSYISAPSGMLRSEYVALDNGQIAPTDSFMSLAQSYPVLKDFLESPEQKPPSVSWINADSLEWPQDDKK